MVVGNNESTATKNAGESMAISIAMSMQRYDAGLISQSSTSRASLEATGCRHRLSHNGFGFVVQFRIRIRYLR